MSEATKAAVLAKCQDVAHQVGSEFLLENGAIVFSGITEYKILGHENGTRISLNHAIPADDWVWPLAAQILNLIPTVDEFEAETTARQYAHDLEQARKEGYEAGKAATLWPAYLAAASRFVGVAGINILNIEELARDAFDKWVATLPPDTLQADRELVAKYLPCLDLIDATARGKAEDCVDEADKLEAALKRVLGLEVGNG